MKKIYLILENSHYFADHIKFGKVDIKKIIAYFKSKDIDLNILDLGDTNIPKDSIVFTTSSQKPYQKQLVDDYLEVLEYQNNILIPSKNIIKAHENKGFQEYYKQLLNFHSLKGIYLNKHNIDYENIKNFIGYPLVLKKLDGSGSKGVQLINTEEKLKKEIFKLQPSLHIRYLIYVKEQVKRIFLRKNNLEKIEYFRDYQNFVIQEFVSNLKFDYKVLIFFDKYYVLKRNIKENDFRASGSGNFEFVEIEDSLLDYAKDTFEVFSEPFISLDICFDGEKYYLIEYQGIHFGPYTQIYSNGYYKKEYDDWKFIKEKVSLEDDISYSLYEYIRLKKFI